MKNRKHVPLECGEEHLYLALLLSVRLVFKFPAFYATCLQQCSALKRFASFRTTVCHLLLLRCLHAAALALPNPQGVRIDHISYLSQCRKEKSSTWWIWYMQDYASAIFKAPGCTSSIYFHWPTNLCGAGARLVSRPTFSFLSTLEWNTPKIAICCKGSNCSWATFIGPPYRPQPV